MVSNPKPKSFEFSPLSPAIASDLGHSGPDRLRGKKNWAAARADKTAQISLLRRSTRSGDFPRARDAPAVVPGARYNMRRSSGYLYL